MSQEIALESIRTWMNRYAPECIIELPPEPAAQLPAPISIIALIGPDGTRATVDLSIWTRTPELAASRLVHLMGKSISHHARKLQFARMTKPEAEVFFNRTHPHGYRKSRWHGGLFTADGTCMMAASFASMRTWERAGHPYLSAELILLSTRTFCSVQGGASKLIMAYIRDKQPHEIVTRSTDEGPVFEKLGFHREEDVNGRLKWRKMVQKHDLR